MKRPIGIPGIMVLLAVVSAVACGEDEKVAAPPPTTSPPSTAAPAAAPPTQAPATAPTAAPTDAGFPPEQLDAMVAPIALYPDALLMQVLMASTYPTEIVMADRWRQDHTDLEGAALDEALAQQEWDPSVSSLAFFPDVLHRMSENLEWTTDLGDAFLAQQDDVMDACQRMRTKASEAGTLKTTKEQTVIVEKEVVRIEPADPEVVYVPQYNTTTAYGSTYQPPPQYYPAAQTGYSGATLAATGLLSFGAGMLTSYALWGDCDWDDHDVYYGGYGGGGGPKYTHKTNIGGKGDDTININVGGDRGRNEWNHDPTHRRGVAYPDHHSRERYAKNDPRRGRFEEGRARGHDRGTDLGSRDSPGGRPGGAPGQARPPKMPERPTAKPAQKKPSQMARPAQKKPSQMAKPAAKTPAKPAARQQAARKPAAGKTAFGGSPNANVQRQASQRGAASRGRSAPSGMGGGGRGGGGGGGGKRGGGGGGGRRG